MFGLHTNLPLSIIGPLIVVGNCGYSLGNVRWGTVSYTFPYRKMFGVNTPFRLDDKGGMSK